MDNIIQINVTDRRAKTLGSPSLICNNSGYVIEFVFDDEWADAPVKTARFVYAKDGQVKKQDVVFEGNTVEIPKLSGVRDIRVGVYAGDLITTTPAWVPYKPSILCSGGVPDEPTEDVYNQIMELFNTIVLEPGAPVDQEFNPESENPQSGKAVAEAVNNIVINTNNIENGAVTIDKAEKNLFNKGIICASSDDIRLVKAQTGKQIQLKATIQKDAITTDKVNETFFC